MRGGVFFIRQGRTTIHLGQLNKIDYDKLSKEQFVTLIEIRKLSKYMKSPISQRGKARPQMVHGKGKRKRK